jgi:hypothetical protein
VNESVHQSHTYSRLSWKPDWSHLDNSLTLQQALTSVEADPEIEVQEMLDLVAHKRPNLKILELNLVPGAAKSLWLSEPVSTQSVRGAVSEFHFACDHTDDVRAAKDLYSKTSSLTCHLLDPRSDAFSQPEGLVNFDLVLVKALYLSISVLERIAGNLRGLLADGRSLIVYQVQSPGHLNGRSTNESVGEIDSETNTAPESKADRDAVTNGYQSLNWADPKLKDHINTENYNLERY